MGGVSDPPYDSLNTSYEVGDRPENVTSNLALIKETLGAGRLVFTRQCHGTRILTMKRKHPRSEVQIQAADALMTDIPYFALLVKQADCQGVILLDPEKGVVANVHCGWRGNVKNILGRVVEGMKHEFGSRERDLVAAIGPSLGPCCGEFMGHADIFPEAFGEFMVRENHFDLWALSRRQLLDAGLTQGNIEICGICTRCTTDLFYSYRGEGVTGRFGTAAMLV